MVMEALPTVSPVLSWFPFDQLEIELVGSNFHGLATGLAMRALPGFGSCIMRAFFTM